MKKAFVLNGGAGRILCALPALEHHIKNIDPTAPIIAEGWQELYLASPEIASNVYSPEHKNIFEIIKDREIISPEPYRLNAYFNQKCNLIQAFDMLINYDTPPEEIPESKEYAFTVGKADQIKGFNLINDIRKQTGRDRVIVFQPFGRGTRMEGELVLDESGRSFELADIITIVKALSREYAVILMSEFMPPVKEPIPAIVPQNLSLLQWMGVIQNADYFLGCDSVGQHMANALGKPATVVIGSTFPENISYPSNKDFIIIDNGKGKRKYSPIRVGWDMAIERNNETLMYLEQQTIADIVNGIYKKLGKNTGYFAKRAKEEQEKAAQAGTCSLDGCGCGPEPTQTTTVSAPPVSESKLTNAIKATVAKKDKKAQQTVGAKVPDKKVK